MTGQALSRVDKFLNVRQSQPQPRHGRLIFALDATASRKPTWDAACQLQAQMFREAGSVGALSMQLVYYRGTHGCGGECRASRWVEDPIELAKLMGGITCLAGHTQIERVLGHAGQEAGRTKINALVFVGDACEEDPDRLVQSAAHLRHLEVPAFVFQEGSDRDVRKTFEEIARVTGGAYHRFDQGSASQLAELLRAVALFSVGGVAALQNGSEAARRLLRQLPPT